MVIEALNAGIPVVTANKTLLAYCGAELFATAAAAGVPLLYEASVLAGTVPFLGTLGRRPLARSVTGFRGILNGTSNFVLTRMARDGAGFDEALASAQRAGFAEPDPSKDIEGDDAVEKLCVLLFRHLAGFDVRPSQIDETGIAGVEQRDQQHRIAVVAYTLAVATKLLPIVLAPLFVGRVKMRDIALGVGALLLLYLPFMTGGTMPIGAVTNVVAHIRFNSPIFRPLAWAVTPSGAAAFALVAALGAAAWARWRLRCRRSGGVGLADGDRARLRAGDLSVVPALLHSVPGDAPRRCR